MVVGTRVPVRVGRCQAKAPIGALIFQIYIVAGWSSLVARRAHNPKVAGSNPAPAIWSSSSAVRIPACYAGGRVFESYTVSNKKRLGGCLKHPSLFLLVQKLEYSDVPKTCYRYKIVGQISFFLYL
jgi:hypothetical protein